MDCLRGAGAKRSERLPEEVVWLDGLNVLVGSGLEHPLKKDEHAALPLTFGAVEGILQLMSWLNMRICPHAS